LASLNNQRLFGTYIDKLSIADGTKSFEDYTTYPTGHASTGSYYSFPVIFTEYNRGGAEDRSMNIEEDYRKISSGYVRLEANGVFQPSFVSEASVYFEKGFWQEAPFELPSGTEYNSVANLSDAIYWLPISIQKQDDVTTGQTYLPNKIYLDFRFDNNNWQPVFDIAAHTNYGVWQLDIDLPTERLPIATAFGVNHPIAGTAEVACYDPVTNTTSQNGSEIRIRINPNASMTANSYVNFPYVNIPEYTKSPLVLLPFRRKLFSFNNAFSLGIAYPVNPAPIYGFRLINDYRGGTYNVNMQGYAWMETYACPALKNVSGETTYAGGNMATATALRNKSQGIDWLYKSPEIGDGKEGLKPRGTITQMSSRGKSDNYSNTSWSLGPYNILVSTNYKQYQGQILDYASTTTNNVQTNTPANNITINKETNITSIEDVSTNTINKKTFNNTTPATLGSTTDSTVGDYLIDSEIFVNKVTSDGTRGERFSYTLFGHMRDKAEKLFIKSVDAMYRVIGSVRRTGR
jgi:hypothetical protein